MSLLILLNSWWKRGLTFSKKSLKNLKENKNIKLIWMLFWEIFFVLFILPWAWLPIVLEFWDHNNEPKWFGWICDQATGNFD